MADSPRKDVPVAGGEWYADGLQFECTRCNQCCTGEPGYVWVDRNRVVSIADFLAMSVREFLTRYCRRVWWRVSLKEMDNGDCVFLTPQGCSIYPVRPEQCRTFPFWPDNLTSRGRWEAVGKRCPGVGKGRLYSLDEIHRIRDGDRVT
jgi:Fe-S-cluster containining protein